jgi:flagellin
MINTDFSNSYIASSALNKANTDAGNAQQRISTSQKINSAQDDPAGYARAIKLKSYIGSYSKAIDNINSGVTLVQSVDSSMSQVSEILTKMRELAVQAAGESNATTRATYQTTFTSYLTDISNVVGQTTYNGSSVMDGTTTSVDVQTGINSGSTKTLAFSDMSATGLNISGVDLANSAADGITSLDTAKLAQYE